MKTLLSHPLIVVLLWFTANSTQAAQPNQDVSTARAHELGIVIKSNPDGENGIKVWLEFEPKGVLKDFTQVNLEIGAPGKRTVAAPLMTSRSAPEKTPEKITVYFSTDPELLATSILTILVQAPDHDRLGLRIQVKDFVEAAPKKAAWAHPVSRESGHHRSR